MSNRQDGTNFESDLCDELSAAGFWAHNFTQNAAGQPVDIIAVKDDLPCLIDCKRCYTGLLSVSRVEPNQEAAALKWWSSGNTEVWFACLYEEEVYMVALKQIQEMEGAGFRSIDVRIYQTLGEWVEQYASDHRRKH